MLPTAKIGPYTLPNPLIVAPMAGVTDRPFRQLCRRLGAGLAVSEMVIADSKLWHTRKSRTRMNHDGEPEPRSVQIAGGDPEMMADAARRNAELGAQIIDINMGCPAKKVCNKAAGSALMRDERLVGEILEAVVQAVDVPVTLKMRTGWSAEHRNAPVMDGYPKHHWNDMTLANGMLIAAALQNANIDPLAHAMLEGHWLNNAN